MRWCWLRSDALWATTQQSQITIKLHLSGNHIVRNRISTVYFQNLKWNTMEDEGGN